MNRIAERVAARMLQGTGNFSRDLEEIREYLDNAEEIYRKGFQREKDGLSKDYIGIQINLKQAFLKTESLYDRMKSGRVAGIVASDAHHHEDGGKWYVDTAFINMVQRVYPNARLEHMGFGEFYLDTPDGKLEFDRMRGKDFEGQSGRSHQIYDNAGGKVVKKAIKLMEQKGKSILS